MKRPTRINPRQSGPKAAQCALRSWVQAAIAGRMNKTPRQPPLAQGPAMAGESRLRNLVPPCLRRCCDIAAPKGPFCATCDLALHLRVSDCRVSGCDSFSLLASLRCLVCGCNLPRDASAFAVVGSNSGGGLKFKFRFLKDCAYAQHQYVVVDHTRLARPRTHIDTNLRVLYTSPRQARPPGARSRGDQG